MTCLAVSKRALATAARTGLSNLLDGHGEVILKEFNSRLATAGELKVVRNPPVPLTPPDYVRPQRLRQTRLGFAPTGEGSVVDFAEFSGSEFAVMLRRLILWARRGRSTMQRSPHRIEAEGLYSSRGSYRSLCAHAYAKRTRAPE